MHIPLDHNFPHFQTLVNCLGLFYFISIGFFGGGGGWYYQRKKHNEKDNLQKRYPLRCSSVNLRYFLMLSLLFMKVTYQDVKRGIFLKDLVVAKIVSIYYVYNEYEVGQKNLYWLSSALLNIYSLFYSIFSDCYRGRKSRLTQFI